MLAVAIDLAGHGESGQSRGEYSIETFGRDVATVADRIGLRDIILVGHSMGGAVILAAEQLLEGRVRLLVGVDTYVYAPYEKHTEEQIAEKIADIRSDVSGKLNSNFRSWFDPKTDLAIVDQTVSAVLQTPESVLVSSMAANRRWDTLTALKRTKTPIACIFSSFINHERDFVTKYSAYFDTIDYADCGHFIMLEKPAVFAEFIDRILAAL
jgi:pimeloyl-ACP methyl ester carboxylesterase